MRRERRELSELTHVRTKTQERSNRTEGMRFRTGPCPPDRWFRLLLLALLKAAAASAALFQQADGGLEGSERATTTASARASSTSSSAHATVGQVESSALSSSSGYIVAALGSAALDSSSLAGSSHLLPAPLLNGSTHADKIAPDDPSRKGDPSKSSSSSSLLAKSRGCGVYLAPSSIPGAGMGMYAGRSYREGDTVTPGDIVIPITDWSSHNWQINIEDIVLQSYYWLPYAYVLLMPFVT
jgi:hypothetical protein